MKNKVAIFWFRRDLRIEDNHGLYEALKSPWPVLPIFIFGYPWYSSCFGAFVIKNSNDIVNSFKEIKKLNNYIISNEVENFINRIYPYLIDGYTGIKGVNGEEPNLDLLAESFSKKLHSYAIQIK